MDNLLIELKTITDRGYTVEFMADGTVWLTGDVRVPWQIGAGAHDAPSLAAIKRANELGVSISIRGDKPSSGIEVKLMRADRRMVWLTPWKLIEDGNLDIFSFDLDRNAGVIGDG